MKLLFACVLFLPLTLVVGEELRGRGGPKGPKQGHAAGNDRRELQTEVPYKRLMYRPGRDPGIGPLGLCEGDCDF